MTLIVTIALALCAGPSPAAEFDHNHPAWSELLGRHVRWNPAGSNTQVDYAGFQINLEELQHYLDGLAVVDMPEYLRWPQAERIAFLVNAYNAWTIALVLERYPDIDSIRDIGGVFSSPWKVRFARLLGETRTLDEIEHELLRGAPDFDEPRIHFSVNCASIGCPALRPEAYRADALDAQLEDQTRRFLGDRSRNSFDSARRRLAVSPIFRWYTDDFATGNADLAPPRGFVASYADTLTSAPGDAASIRAGDYRLRYTRYDWSLNDNRQRH